MVFIFGFGCFARRVLMGRHHRVRRADHNGYEQFENKDQNPELVAEQWLSNAEQDLIVAETLYKAGHYTWAAFACQQSLEKLLKAGYVKSRHKIPPHLHKLERLSAIMKLDPTLDILGSLIEIDNCYTSTRYPGYKHDLCPRTREESKNIIDKTKATYLWLKRELQL
jgi:HEPN domain-containing protein